MLDRKAGPTSSLCDQTSVDGALRQKELNNQIGPIVKQVMKVATNRKAHHLGQYETLSPNTNKELPVYFLTSSS